MKDFIHLKEWWTATEIAEAALPEMPTTRQGVEALAKANDWRAHPEAARKRSGRGGGWEYSWRLFPLRAQRQLMAGHADAPEVSSDWSNAGEAWAYFDSLPDKTKEEARKKLTVLQQVQDIARVATKHLAVEVIAKSSGKSARTIWNWFSLVDGIDPNDWLPYLAPRHRAASRSTATAEADQEFYDWLKADFLRLEGPSFRACYRRVEGLCKARGISMLTERTAKRWMDRTIPEVSQVYMREGERGLLKRYPPQIRDRSTLSALEGVNADCHKIDVFVNWPGYDKPIRPQVVAFQDLYSNKILSWRVDVDPNKVAVMSALRELFEKWGIPYHVLFDNGREFANKWLTGGAPTRFRFKVREDEPLGVLMLLGAKIHWATPGHGQAKPIERGFRDLAEDVAKDPRFAGAYVGHRPDAKPENYMSKAIELEQFLQVLAEGIAAHNARQGRLSATAKGRSFDDTFLESYERTPVRKATEEQLRLCLMAQEVRKLHRTHGRMTLHRNAYWSEWMNEYAGKKVVARFNPEDLHAGAHIYSLEGAFLGYAACQEKSEFFDLASAQAAAKERARHLREQRAIARRARPVSVGGLSAELDKLPKREEVTAETKVVKLANVTEIRRLEDRKRGALIKAPLPTPETSPELDARLLDFQKRHAEQKAGATAGSADAGQSQKERDFYRMLEIERRSAAGEPVGEAEASWHARVSTLPHMKALRTAYERFGEAAIH